MTTGPATEAEERALRRNAARVARWSPGFRNACASLATGADRGYGHAWAESRAAAERQAMGHCREKFVELQGRRLGLHGALNGSIPTAPACPTLTKP